MKIKHILMSLHPKFGGPTVSVPTQCIGLQRLGSEVSLVTYSDSKPYDQQLIENGVEMIEFDYPKNPILKLLQWPFKQELSKNDDYDIYHCHGAWSPYSHWGARSAIRQGKPFVINPRGDLELYRINYDKLKKVKKLLAWKLYIKYNFNKAACIIATSLQEAKAVRNMGVSSPIAIIPNGMVVECFPAPVNIKKTGDKKILLFLSRVNKIKGLELLLEAWSKLPENIKCNWELQIAGNSDPLDYIDSLKKLVTEYRIEENVVFLGPLTGNDKIKKYQEASLFILPTFNENFGNVIAEAMLCECPAITTTNAPWNCLIEDKCGWWIDLSVDNLIKTMIEGMSLPDQVLADMGKKSRQCILNRFSSESIAKQTLNLYEWILGKSEKPDFVYIK